MYYELEVKGNDGFISSTRVKADSFSHACMRAHLFQEVMRKQTIEEVG